MTRERKRRTRKVAPEPWPTTPTGIRVALTIDVPVASLALLPEGVRRALLDGLAKVLSAQAEADRERALRSGPPTPAGESPEQTDG